jgi:hypothetical protein
VVFPDAIQPNVDSNTSKLHDANILWQDQWVWAVWKWELDQAHRRRDRDLRHVSDGGCQVVNAHCCPASPAGNPPNSVKWKGSIKGLTVKFFLEISVESRVWVLCRQCLQRRAKKRLLDQ